MCDSTPVRAPVKTRTILIVAFAFACLMVTSAFACMIVALFFREPVSPEPLRPVSLQIKLHDTDVMLSNDGRYMNREGTATYIFKNNLAIPVKLVFPPIGFTRRWAPITPECCSKEKMPDFCQEPQVIEFPPYAEKRFTSKFGNILTPAHGASFSARFIFGPSDDPDQKNVLVDLVEGVGKFEDAGITEEK